MEAKANAEMKVKVTQVRSLIGRSERVRRTLDALGLGRIGKMKLHTLNDSTRGMLKKVEHLIRVEKAD
jgi:large subunit ribosomal protein L30